jgi:hypothetical protein
MESKRLWNCTLQFRAGGLQATAAERSMRGTISFSPELRNDMQNMQTMHTDKLLNRPESFSGALTAA